MNDGTERELHNPADMPDVVKVAEIHEPWIRATILTPDDYLGGILKLCQDRRGLQIELTYVGKRAMLTYDLPLNEVVFDFYDRLKSISKGYASFDYHLTDHREGHLVKLSVLVNGEPVDALSMMVHRMAAERRGRDMCEKAQGPDPQAHVQDPDPGGHRRQRHCPRNQSRRCARTSRRNATAATPRASASCWTSKRPARSACASSARWTSPRKRSSPR